MSQFAQEKTCLFFGRGNCRAHCNNDRLLHCQHVQTGYGGKETSGRTICEEEQNERNLEEKILEEKGKIVFNYMLAFWCTLRNKRQESARMDNLSGVSHQTSADQPHNSRSQLAAFRF